jgi:hypothetical protein
MSVKTCPYIPKQGINKGIRCDKILVKTDFCHNHISSVINENLKHNCKYIYKAGKNRGKVCNKLIHVKFDHCTRHDKRLTPNQRKEYYKKRRNECTARQRKYYYKHHDTIRNRLKQYYMYKKNINNNNFKTIAKTLYDIKKKYNELHKAEILEQQKKDRLLKSAEEILKNEPFEELSTILEFE